MPFGVPVTLRGFVAQPFFHATLGDLYRWAFPVRVHVIAGDTWGFVLVTLHSDT